LLEFKRGNGNGKPFCHWAVYIGPVRGRATGVADPANLNHALVHMHGPDNPQFQLMNFNQSGHPISFGVSIPFFGSVNSFEKFCSTK